MKQKNTKEIFENYEPEAITDEIIEEIETNLKDYFTTLIEWVQENKEEENG